jgi:hypothetical protein
MTNGGPDSHSHVARIYQRDDDTIELYVHTASFTPGQEVEVSCYLTQGATYAAFNHVKWIPIPESDREETAVLHVQLPAMTLDPDAPVTVVTRVAEVWPTVLQKDSGVGASYAGPGLKAAWTAKELWGKGPGDPASPAQSGQQA